MISSFYERIIGASSTSGSNGTKIMCVGLCCLDIVQTCKHFPLEDSDQRSIEYWWQRGGNASNSCTVLSLLGSQCEFLGTLSTDEHVNFLQKDMQKHNIQFSHCPMIEGVGCPLSTIILSLTSGSRTILHHNPNMPELKLKDFMQLNLKEYSWVHFEGRNVVEVVSMMQYIESYNNSLNGAQNQDSENLRVTISVELEIAKPDLLDLLPYADVAFVAKDFARSRGYDNMSETVRNISEEAKSGATIICAWGDRGAMARTPDGVIVQSPAFPPPKIIDSLGAGDTFNGAVLYYLTESKQNLINKCIGKVDDVNMISMFEKECQFKGEVKQNYNIESLERSKTEFIDQNILQAAITFGCRVAGTKIGMKGYEGLQQNFSKTS